ncbi:MAG: ATP-binding protein [Alphaproteobacteria bacterium]|jgi:anti-sigma regulatory factor (Ser/Thr protein kinase)|nr:ATP-binding protein [Alphaproteobacteria bacterium]MDP6832086.1 ATP-binding protein [Alphaproteobacteria bacterium]MDP6875563.1 ATP-binding protein [Alphaproteobacteria bacterium]
MMEQGGQTQLRIENKLAEIASVMAAFDGFAMEHGLPPAIVSRFKLFFDELLSNTIRHGYSDQENHEIEIALCCRDGRLTVTISDDGMPFDPLSAPAPKIEVALAERELRGLGIHLVRNMLQDAHYRRAEGRNIITLMENLE